MARITGRVDPKYIIELPDNLYEARFSFANEALLFEMHSFNIRSRPMGIGIDQIELTLLKGFTPNPKHRKPLAIGDFVHMGTQDDPRYEIISERKGYWWLEREDGVMVSAPKDTVRRA